MLRIALVEDDDSDLARLQEHLQRFSQEKGIALQTSVFRNGEQLLFSYQPVYDIVLMDIEMPKMDGMTAAQRLRELDPSVILIFITNMAQYAIQGYRVHARAYLLKPLQYISFAMELADAAQAVDTLPEDAFLLRSENGVIRLNAADILYIESQKHDQLFHTRTGVYSMRATMAELEQRLAPLWFERSSVSFLVNLRCVTGVERDAVLLGEERVPLSRQKRKRFLEALTYYIGGSGHA